MMLKELQKSLKTHHILLILGGLVLIYVIFNYSSNKGMPMPENYSNKQKQMTTGVSSNMPPVGASENTFYVDSAPVNATNGNAMPGLPTNCTGQAMNTPSDLLPKDGNSDWALKPQGSGDFLGVNFLNAGYLIGVDTIGSSLRNSNLQVRSEPPNPQIVVSPWMNTTIEPDPFRQPLEIGCGPQ